MLPVRGKAGFTFSIEVQNVFWLAERLFRANVDDFEIVSLSLGSRIEATHLYDH